MISNILYIKRIEGENFYFQYRPNEKDEASRFGNRIGIDGLEWIYNHKKYGLLFSDFPYGDCCFLEEKLLVITDLDKKTIGTDLVIYTPKGEVDKVLSTPILPTGKQGAGFMQIGDLKGWETIPKGFENWLSVWVWEHERSEWVYQYFFNPDTYEFVFGHKFRN